MRCGQAPSLAILAMPFSVTRKRHGFSVVREFCGHGIGREMHETPEVLHWGRRKTGIVLQEGMVFTIEPM